MHRRNINMGPSALCYRLIACLSTKKKKKQQKQKQCEVVSFKFAMPQCMNKGCIVKL